MAKTRKRYTKSVGSMEKTLELHEASQTSELKGEKQIAVDFSAAKGGRA